MTDDDDLLAELGRAISPTVPPVDPARLAALRGTVDELGQAISPTVPPVDPARLAALRSTVDELGAAGPPPAAEVVPLRSRRSLLQGAAAAVGGVAAGAAATFLVVRDDEPAGPPMEAAAVETAAGIEASANLIAHTWGLEVLLDVSGLEPGAPYEMTFVDRQGRRISAGGAVGTDGLVRCRNNGAILRSDVARIVLTATDGTDVVHADLV